MRRYLVLAFAGGLSLGSPAVAGVLDEAPQCEAYVPVPLTAEELAEAGFHPGGVRPFLLALFAGPRIALEWNDGRGVRPIELLRSVPYLGNLVGLYLCTEALSGYRMTAVAAETGVDTWRRRLYFQRIAQLEAQAQLREPGEIRYEDPEPVLGPPKGASPLAAEPSAADWVALRSNGVLEDRFLATLSRELDASPQAVSRPRSPRAEPRSGP